MKTSFCAVFILVPKCYKVLTRFPNVTRFLPDTDPLAKSGSRSLPDIRRSGAGREGLAWPKVVPNLLNETNLMSIWFSRVRALKKLKLVLKWCLSPKANMQFTQSWVKKVGKELNPIPYQIYYITFMLTLESQCIPVAGGVLYLKTVPNG